MNTASQAVTRGFAILSLGATLALWAPRVAFAEDDDCQAITRGHCCEGFVEGVLVYQSCCEDAVPTTCKVARNEGICTFTSTCPSSGSSGDDCSDSLVPCDDQPL